MNIGTCFLEHIAAASKNQALRLVGLEARIRRGVVEAPRLDRPT